MSVSTLAAPLRGEPDFPDLSDADLRRLLRIARRFLGCDHLAQDALQEALLALVSQPEPPADPRYWLAAAVVHRSRHLRRTVRRRRHHEHVASSHCKLHDECDNPIHVAVAHELGEALAAARESLTPEQREVLHLFESSGKSYEEIAIALGVPIGTVRSRLARARRVLQGATEAR